MALIISSIGSRFQVPHALCYQRSFRGQFSLRARRRRFKRRKRTIKIRCSFIAVGNGPFYGNNLAVCPGAILDDGLLSISVFRDFSKLELVWHFWSISQAGASTIRNLRCSKARRSRFLPLSLYRCMWMGKPIGTTPVRFRVSPKALKVVAK